MKILKTTDIITVKNNELEVDFSPLNYAQSIEVEGTSSIKSGNVVTDQAASVATILKYAVKEVRGVTDWDGNPIEIKSGNELSDEQLDLVITSLSKSVVMGHVSYISTSRDLDIKEMEGIEIMLNGKAVELKK
jgi:hypothetical protein